MSASELLPPAVRPLPAIDRLKWLMAYIDANVQRGGVDVLDRDFVDAYTEATRAGFKQVCWGANKCPMLGRDLARMARSGGLRRYRTGLGMNWQPGFPKWVWSYEPGHAAYLYRSNTDSATEKL